MDRSLFPDGVEVRQTDLENTETTRSFHIRQRQKDSTDPGVVSGFTVTLNTGNNTLIDIAPGTGYAPNGEYVETTVSTTALSLAEYANNQNNYVVAFYTESNVNLRGHETNGLSFPTRATRSVFIRVLNLTEFGTLPSTDENLANTAADRAVLLAIVNANGAGVNLTASDITNATAFQNAISAFNTTNNVSGVTISSIDRTTATGSGYLIFTTTPDLAWQAPGDSVGSAIVLTGSGPVTLTSSNGKTITVDVDFAAIPGAGQTDTITVSNIYDQTVKRNTSIDEQHRSLIGSGVPTVTNPHGITLEDLGVSGGEVEIHQDLFHSNGIDRNSASTVLEVDVNTTSDDSLDIVGLPSGGDAFYLDGAKHTQLIGSNIDWSDISDQNQSLWDIYVVKGLAGQATLAKVKRAQYDNTSTSLEEVVQLRDMNLDMPSGTVTIDFVFANQELQFKVATDVGFGTPVALPTGGAATDGTTLRLFNESGEHYVDVFVADDSNPNWPGSDQTENLTVSVLPGLETRLRIATVMYEFNGSDRFLGNGYQSTENLPNDHVDQRLFGLTGLDDLRDDARLWEDSVSAFPSATPAAVTETRDVGIGIKFPRGNFHVKGEEPLEILSADPNKDVRKRFVEGDGYRGGFLRYDGLLNDFIIGVHDPDDEDLANDTNSIVITRANGEVDIRNGLVVSDGIVGSLGIGIATPSFQVHINGPSPIIQLTDTGTGSNARIDGSGTSGSLILQADENNTVASTVMGFDVDGTRRLTLDPTECLFNYTRNFGYDDGQNCWYISNPNPVDPGFTDSRALNVSSPSGDSKRFAAIFGNEFESTSSYGIGIHCGDQSHATGTYYFIRCWDNDGDEQGGLNNINGTFGLYQGSDTRWKADVAPTKVNGIEIISNIDLIEFRRKSKKDVAPAPNTPLNQIGFSAQNLEKVFPSVVAPNSSGKLMVAQDNLIPVLTKAIQELTAKIKVLENKLLK